jgi:nucleoside-diphosphate-sugar epimerase
MLVAVTGGTGFLGEHVLRVLTRAGHRVRALARRPQADRAGVTWIAGALDDPSALTTLCAGADAVIHSAGVVSGTAAAFDAGNRLGTLAMIGAADTAGVARFVHVSSLSAREPQLSLYGASKRAAEDAVVAAALDWRIVRPPAIYGPGETEMLDMFKLARRGFVPLPPGGRGSWVHATDMARLLVALAERGPARAFYEADDGHAAGWSHKEIAAMIGAAVGRKPLALPLPKALLGLAARADTLFRGDAAKLTPDRVGYLNHRDWTVSDALRPPAALWQPAIDTADGLKAMAEDYRARGLL